MASFSSDEKTRLEATWDILFQPFCWLRRAGQPGVDFSSPGSPSIDFTLCEPSPWDSGAGNAV